MFSHDLIYKENQKDFLRFSLCEDRHKNLTRYLMKEFSWDNKTVLEAGAGMGRITDKYIDKIKDLTLTDKSIEMLKYCKKKYNYKEKNIQYLCCDHKNLASNLKDKHFEIFICAYSLSYVAMELDDKAFEDFLTTFFSINADQFIIIENIGIFSKNDTYVRPYFNYFDFLSKKFKSLEIKTDFSFKDVNEAVYYAEMFFGKDTAETVKEIGSKDLPEISCIWYNKN